MGTLAEGSSREPARRRGPAQEEIERILVGWNEINLERARNEDRWEGRRRSQSNAG